MSAVRYGYAVGVDPEVYGPADFDSPREALLEAIGAEGLEVGDVVATCRANFISPAALLAKHVDVRDLIERVDKSIAEAGDVAGLDEAYLEPSREACEWLRIRLAEVFDEWARTYTVARSWYRAEDVTEHTVTEADLAEVDEARA